MAQKSFQTNFTILTDVEGVSEIKNLGRQLENLTKSVDKVARNFEKSQASAKSFNQTVERTNNTVGKSAGVNDLLNSSVLRIGVQYGAATLAVGQFTAALRKVMEVQSKIDQLNSTLNIVNSGDINRTAADIDYLRQTTERLGLNFTKTSELFAKMSAAASVTNLTTEDTRKIFESFAGAIGRLNLSADSSNRIFFALTQSISKGTLSAEELKQQLGEKLPGVMSIAARAFDGGKGDVDAFSKALEQGKIITADFLPKLAEEVAKTFNVESNTRIETATANVNRFENAFDDLQRTIVGAGLGDFVEKIFGGAADQMESLATAIENGTGAIGKLTTALGELDFEKLKFLAEVFIGLRGASVGAAAGSAFGPLGSAIGAGVGYITAVAGTSEVIEQATNEAERNAQALRERQDKLREEIQDLKNVKQFNFIRRPDELIDADIAAKTQELLEVQLELNGATDAYSIAVANAATAVSTMGRASDDDVKRKAAQAEADRKAAEAREKFVARFMTSQEKMNAELAKARELFGDVLPSGLEAKIRAKYIKPVSDAKKKTKALSDEVKFFIKQMEDLSKAYGKSLDDIDSQIESIKKEAEQIGKTEKELKELERQKLDNLIVDKETRAEAIRRQGTTTQELALLDLEIQKLKELRAEKANLEVLVESEAANQARQKLIEKNAEIAKQFEDDLVSAFEDAFLRGGDFAESFKRAIEAQFAKMVLRPIIQAIVSPIAGGVNQLLGLGGTGSNLISGGGFGGGIGNPLSLGDAFGSFGSGFSNSAFMFEDAALELGNTIANTFGDSAFSDAILNNSQTIGQVGATLGAIGTAVSGFNALKNGQYGSAAGQGIGYAFGGPVGAAIGGAIGGALDKTFSGEKRIGTGIEVNAAGVSSNTGNDGRFLAREASEQVSQLAFESINMALKDLGSDRQLSRLTGALQTSGKGRGGVMASALFADGQEVGDMFYSQGLQWEQNRNTSPDAEKAFELYLEQLDQVFLQTLQATSGDFAQNIDQYLQSLGDVELLSPEQLATAKANVALLNAVNNEFSKMEGSLSALSNQSLQTVQTFLQAVGGLENFNGLFSSYVSAIYDDSEQLALSQRNLAQAFERLNVDVIPTTRDEFQALVESLDVTSKEGANLYAQLLQLAPAFAQVTDATQAASQAALDYASNRIKELGQIIDKEFADYQQAVNARNQAIAQAEQNLIQSYNQALREAQQIIRATEQAFAEAQREADAFFNKIGQAFEQFISAGQAISEVIKQLVGANQAQAQQDFQNLLVRGMKGDLDALNALPQAALTLAEQQVSTATTGADADRIKGLIAAQLAALPATKSFEQQLLDKVSESNTLLGFIDLNGDNTISKLEAVISSIQGENGVLLDELDGLFSKSTTITSEAIRQALKGKASDASIDALINRLDENQDGVITTLELANGKLNTLADSIAKSIAPLFGTIDTTLDNLIDYNEFKAAFAELGLGEKLADIFNELDINADGQIDREEALIGRVDELSTARDDANYASAQIQALQASIGSFGVIVDGLGSSLGSSFEELIVSFQNTVSEVNEALAEYGASVSSPTPSAPSSSDSTTTQPTNAFNDSVYEQSILQYLKSEGETATLQEIQNQGGLLSYFKGFGYNSFQAHYLDNKDFIDSLGIRTFRNGGFVSGAGTGTSDSIMARISNGEFVMNARSTQRMRPMLEMMNQGRMPMMGSDPALLREIQMMRMELENMRAETRATAVNTGKSAKLMERFDDGDALLVRVEA